ncbi:MAG: RagB/SusD family nutrient uptake outer membrane protein [Tannerellaceae bacterium]|nr:RagB/SusD family nutrient uptake outer membrane protein [Tannerellaceae bacterium]
MKYNTIKNIVAGATLLFTTVSCTDFLSETPEGIMDAEAYFTTAEGYEYMVKAAYEPVRYVTRKTEPFALGTDIYTQPGQGMDDRYETDKAEYNRRYLQGFNEYFRTAVNASEGWLANFFFDCYNLIQRSNNVISYGQRADIPESVRKQRAAEARFLRAFAYFYLVQTYSDVPLLTEEITTPHMTAERTPEKDIYEFIITDLEASYNDLAPKNQQPEYGRVTRGAAKTLLSKIYLTRSWKSFAESNDARKAYDLAEDVIKNEGYTLLADFNDIFEEGNEENDEIIFAAQYSTNRQTNWGGNTDYSTFQPFLYSIPGMGAKTEYLERYMGKAAPTRAAYLLFDRSWDTRFDKTFQREYFANEEKAWDQGAFGEIQVGQKMFHFVFPDEPQMSRDEKDTYPYFVVNFDEYYDQPLVGGLKDDNGDYRVNGFARDEKGDDTKPRYYVYPGIKKFRDSRALYSDGGEEGTRDHFEMRLGEVYLIAAEASMKAGSGDGTGYLQTLRNRAAGGSGAPALELTIDNILDERARELMGEDRRFFDLKRTGKLRERVITKKMNERAARALEVWGEENAFKDEYINRPLPYDWMRYLQNEISQNPGYDY